MYPNVLSAASAITEAAGVRGLFTGYLPTLLEDVPDMAFKFAAYESLRSLHRRLNHGRPANVQVRCWDTHHAWLHWDRRGNKLQTGQALRKPHASQGR